MSVDNSFNNVALYHPVCLLLVWRSYQKYAINVKTRKNKEKIATTKLFILCIRLEYIWTHIPHNATQIGCLNGTRYLLAINTEPKDAQKLNLNWNTQKITINNRNIEMTKAYYIYSPQNKPKIIFKEANANVQLRADKIIFKNRS